MMRSVKAPEGYEGCVQWMDGSRSWEAAAKPIGATWWTLCGGPFGHAHMADVAVDEIAIANIERWIRLGMVK